MSRDKLRLTRSHLLESRRRDAGCFEAWLLESCRPVSAACTAEERAWSQLPCSGCRPRGSRLIGLTALAIARGKDATPPSRFRSPATPHMRCARYHPTAPRVIRHAGGLSRAHRDYEGPGGANAREAGSTCGCRTHRKWFDSVRATSNSGTAQGDMVSK